MKQPPKGWRIEYNPKPIPSWVGVDWDFWHDNYDADLSIGESNGLSGYGGSYADCVRQIEEIEAEHPYFQGAE